MGSRVSPGTPQTLYLVDATRAPPRCPQGSATRPRKGWSVIVHPVQSTALVAAIYSASGTAFDSPPIAPPISPPTLIPRWFPHSNRKVPLQQPERHVFRLVADSITVPAEELLVPLQHPFWGDVSPSTRCEAAWFLLRVGTALGWRPRRSKAASEETARDSSKKGCLPRKLHLINSQLRRLRRYYDPSLFSVALD